MVDLIYTPVVTVEGTNAQKRWRADRWKPYDAIVTSSHNTHMRHSDIENDPWQKEIPGRESESKI